VLTRLEDGVDGIYAMNFRGAVGWGMGLLELRHGIVAGADVLGVTYDGTYSETEQEIRLDLRLTIPPGVSLVQGTAPRPIEYSVPFQATIPKNAIATSEPILVDLPPGPVNVIVRRLRGLAH
jgi:hypothetical protein